MRVPANQLGALLACLAFAAEKHRSQRRKDAAASPYINHPIALAHVLANEGGVDELDVLCAAILHDTVEDTETTEAELATHFGAHIAAVVMEVTDDQARPKAERKQAQIDHAPHLSRQAKLVKLADKICNLRDIIAAPPHHWSRERRIEYMEWAAHVVAGMRGTHPGLEAIFDALVAQKANLP